MLGPSIRIRWTAFADFLWGAFGLQTKEWLAQGLPRPFDGPNNQSVEVDGFDFDIEFPSSGMCRPLTRYNSQLAYQKLQTTKQDTLL
jgi:hypothetical protein